MTVKPKAFHKKPLPILHTMINLLIRHSVTQPVMYGLLFSVACSGK